MRKVVLVLVVVLGILGVTGSAMADRGGIVILSDTTRSSR
jgi:uncharacterized membrane protein